MCLTLQEDRDFKLNAELYRIAQELNNGVDGDYIDDLCAEVAREFKREKIYIMNKVKQIYRHYFE